MTAERTVTGQYELGEPAPYAHPFIQRLHKELVAKGMSRAELERAIGFARGALFPWWNGDSAVLLLNMEAALNALGLKLEVVAMEPKRIERFHTGFWQTQGGYRALVDRVEVDGTLVGSVIMAGSQGSGRINCSWGWDGKRIPRGGTDPTDLIPGGQA